MRLLLLALAISTAEGRTLYDLFKKEVSRPLLKAVPIEERYEDYYDTIEIGYAWLAGYRPFLFWSNTTNCFDRLTNYTYHERDWYASNYSIAKASDNTFSRINLTTSLIQNASVTGWYCNNMLQSASQYWVDDYERYKEFQNPTGMFFLSFLQNMLANVISINNIYNSIDNNLEINNDTGVHYDLARLGRVLTIFDPIEPVEDDYYFDPTEYDDPDLNTELLAETDWARMDFMRSSIRSVMQTLPTVVMRERKVKDNSLLELFEDEPEGSISDFTSGSNAF